MPEDTRRAVAAAGCWECGEAPAPPMAYALGEIGYDLPSPARRDGFVQQGVHDPDDPAQLLRHLEAHPESSAAVTWTLNQETVPLYAIQPGGAFARQTHARLRRFLDEQLAREVGRVAVPGWVSGTTPLANGQTVPTLWPELRGMSSWPAEALVQALLRRVFRSTKDQDKAGEIASFLERVSSELRNPGLAPPERAINYAATHAVQVERIFELALESHLRLDAIAVEQSPICRPASDCWDVKLTFFNPARRLEQARRVYRFTVDVSDVVPVTVGKVRQWEIS